MQLTSYFIVKKICYSITFNFTNSILVAIECRLQNDDEKLQEKFYLFIRLTAYVIFPLKIGLSVLAKPFNTKNLSAKDVYKRQEFALIRG